MGANGVATQAFVNTFMAGGLAMGMWLIIDCMRTGKASMIGALTGVLAGLVAVTPCAGYVPTWAACLISIIAGAVCYVAVQFRAKRGWDDSLDVWGVHGVGGVLGSLLVGVFSFASVNGVNGLLAGNVKQFGLQCAGVAIVMAYTFTRHVRHLQGARHAADAARAESRPDQGSRRRASRRDRVRSELTRQNARRAGPGPPGPAPRAFLVPGERSRRLLAAPPSPQTMPTAGVGMVKTRVPSSWSSW